MLLLRSPTLGRVELASGATLGRSPGATVCVPAEGVSRLHAQVCWEAGQWLARDLGSRNGTWVNAALIPRGGTAPLTPGSTLAIGPASWTVERAEPPCTSATGPDGRVVRSRSPAAEGAAPGLLALPDSDAPAALVYWDRAGWLLEDERGARPVVAGETVLVGDEAWTLHLPELLPATGASSAVTLELALLELRVSPDEEHVNGTLRLGAQEVDLGARAHLYLLLTLARAREGDLADGVDPAQAGWREVERLARGLRMSQNALYIQSHRVRAQLAEAGVLGAARVIERRGRGALRLGPIAVNVRAA